MVDRKFSRSSSISKLEDFNLWLGEVKPLFKEIYIIGGNHDKILDEMKHKDIQKLLSNGKYVVNEGFEHRGLKFFATPLSEKSYHGESKNTSFQSSDFQKFTLQASKDYYKSQSGESGIDVLVTHGLCSDLVNHIQPKLHLYGHHHSSFGVNMLPGGVLSICSTMMDGKYNIRNPPVVIDIPLPMKRFTLELRSDVSNNHEESMESAGGASQSSPSSFVSSSLTKYLLYSSDLWRMKAVDFKSQRQNNKIVPVDSDQ